MPGKTGTTGHYHKRALISAVIGIVLVAIAVYLGVTAQRSTATQVGSTPEPAVGPAPGGATAHDAGGEGNAI